MEKVSIFVDGANMYYSQKRLGWYIDFRKALNYFRETYGTIAEAYYYTVSDPASRNRDAHFHDYLTYSGFTVRVRNAKNPNAEATGEGNDFVDLGVDIIIDMFDTVNLYDTAVLLSGAGCFERALEALRTKGKKVIVIAHPEMTSRELRNTVGMNFVDIRDIAPYVSRTDRAPDLDAEEELEEQLKSNSTKLKKKKASSD